MKKLTQKQVWNDIAKDWRKFRGGPRPEVEGFLKDCSGRILDVGCGSGRHFIKKEELKFFGIDFSEKMIELAKKNAEENKIHAELKMMQNEKIPYPENFFDNIICIAVLHCIETKEKRLILLGEIKRVLKPGGSLFLQVWSRNHNRVKNKGKEPMIPWTVEGKKIGRHYHIYDLEELKKEVEKIGLEILHLEEDENINLLAKRLC